MTALNRYSQQVPAHAVAMLEGSIQLAELLTRGGMSAIPVVPEANQGQGRVRVRVRIRARVRVMVRVRARV